MEAYQKLDNAFAKNSLLKEAQKKIEYLKTTANKKIKGIKQGYTEKSI